MPQYACTSCGFVEGVPAKLESGQSWTCTDCEMREKEKEEMTQRCHCFHLVGMPAGKGAGWPESCWFCGKKRSIHDREVVPRDEHGRLLEVDATQAKMYLDLSTTEECPARKKKEVALHA